MRRKKCRLSCRRTVLRLPDLDHSKLAVLNSLTSPASRRVYEYAIDQFTAWYWQPKPRHFTEWRIETSSRPNGP